MRRCENDLTMSSGQHTILDVVELLVDSGRWSAGTIGTVVSRRRSRAYLLRTGASSLACAAALEVTPRGTDIARDMNYQSPIPRDGEQAEVLKDKLTPKAIVAALNEHIVGQDDAKKAVAVALRNRWRRLQLDERVVQLVGDPVALGRIVGASAIITGSLHHQAIARRAPDLRLVARTDDGIVEALEALVRDCLAKQPDKRPRDATELAQRFEVALGKRLSAPRRSSSGLFNLKQPPPMPAKHDSSPRLPTPPISAADRHALRQEFEANMPEAMAMLKLKGFLHDLGSEVVETVPGMIRVRLGQTEKPKKRSGIFSLLERGERKSGVVQLAATTDLELRMERRDPAQPNRLHITLIMRPGSGPATAEWRTRCQKIGMDLNAYLMGR